MSAAVELNELVARYGKKVAVDRVSLSASVGRCHALFGRNGAGKSTLLHCALGLLRPSGGKVRVLGLDPLAEDEAVKAKVAFVPDSPAFYPWMRVQEVLDYDASFRPRWRREVERELVEKFGLDPRAPTPTLSRGQRTQLALTAAVAADPEVLFLDEPTEGLDPLVRRQFLEAVVGAFQDRQPEAKTIIVSSHLIQEMEGVVDEFSVLDAGRLVLTTTADAARGRFRRLRASFPGDAPERLSFASLRPPKRDGRTLDVVVDGNLEAARESLRREGALQVEESALSLEDIFLATGCP